MLSPQLGPQDRKSDNVNGYFRAGYIKVEQPQSPIAFDQIIPGKTFDLQFRDPTNANYSVVGYSQKFTGGVATIDYKVRGENLFTGYRKDDEFTIRVHVLTNNGAVPSDMLPTKADPCYVLDGEGKNRWLYIETIPADRSTHAFETRYKLATPHYGPESATERADAEGTGKAYIAKDNNGRYSVSLSCYLFSKGNRRSMISIHGWLAPEAVKPN